MRVYITKRMSKKQTTYVCLMINDVIVSFDTMTILKVANLTPSDLTKLGVGDIIEIK